jgi:hypothetical protein
VASGLPAFGSAYRLDQLGWLQFERVCSALLEAEFALRDVGWVGHADLGRVALVDLPVPGAGQGLALEGPVTVAIVWVAEGSSERLAASVTESIAARERVAARLTERIAGLSTEFGAWCRDQILVLTNVDGAVALQVGRRGFGDADRVEVWAAQEVSAALDRHAVARAAMPSVLGLRDLDPLIADGVRARSSLDVERAQALARVFWPTRAYDRARAVLAQHRFVVLTGPPEMGKTAIAQMLGLALMTNGWEAHECNSPEQLWRVFDPGRRQVFVADDAFGSTEYRPDAAERWARSLGRLLGMLDGDHWLIWTSRPAPLRAGLRRVQSERGSERFPSPGEVLVDASDLDLAEKTLILFRHAKATDASRPALQLVRSAALTIVEHPHFTPERIRRFVTDRLETLPRIAATADRDAVREELEHELAYPTDAMRTSFRALEPEHRELLIALLDAPAGLIDERELAATVRRHHTGALRRPPAELIDRLTDHFLRITSLGIGWVHPSWRDLVIDELRRDEAARGRFLDACSVHGAALAVSTEGGVAGERTLPLLGTDADWDRLTDRLHQLLAELEDQELGRLLAAFRNLRDARITRTQKHEARNLAACLVKRIARRWDQSGQPVAVFLLEAWYAVTEWAPGPIDRPDLSNTWAELHPRSIVSVAPDRADLLRADDWLTLIAVLLRYDVDALTALGFLEREEELLTRLANWITFTTDPDSRPVVESILARIKEYGPTKSWAAANTATAALRNESLTGTQWWTPEDIAAPPTQDLIPTGPVEFTRADVDRVLTDL